jgi:chloramphenicol-sensitive protein RarD
MHYNPIRSGYLYGLGALTIWGILPLYWKQLAAIPSLELIGHRAAWSVLFLLSYCALRGESRQLLAIASSPRKFLPLLLTGGLIASNWLVYVWAVNHNQLLEASLGYFISPLVTIALGAVLLHEPLCLRKKFAITLAAVAVCIKAIGAGVVPWIGVYLAISMSLYGFLRKQLAVPSLIGLTVETLLLLPIALGYLGFLALTNSSHFLSEGTTGICTSVPLMWFVRAGQLLPLSTLGILQYLSPILQFLLAVSLFNEAISTGDIASFLMIWIAIAVYLYRE